jgi:hypothetical protein
MPSSHDAVLARIKTLYEMLFEHSGYGEMQIEIRFLRKREKEVLIRCGKQYRFIVPCECVCEECEDGCPEKPGCSEGKKSAIGRGSRGGR